MRLVLKMRPEGNVLELPIDYRYIMQGILYGKIRDDGWSAFCMTRGI